MLLNMLNKLDGGASVGLLAELSGLHRTTVRRLLETLLEEGYVRRSTHDSFLSDHQSAAIKRRIS